MTVDDASTLRKDGAKIEFGWSGDKNTKGMDGVAGLAPIENLEIEVGLDRTRDRTSSPSEMIYGRGLALKWVPLQSAAGLSLGLKYELSHDRAEVVTRTHTLIGLLSWSFLNESIVHVNIGREAAYEDDTRKRGTIWGTGLDWPLTDTLRGTAEIYGVQRSGPNRAVGLRYEIMEGLKLSGAIGRGNKLTFSNVGIAWEF